MNWLSVTEHLCHKWRRVCSTCCIHFPVLSSFRTCHRVCYQSNTTGATSGSGTATFPEHLNSLPIFSGVRVTRFLILCLVLCRSLFVLFLLAILLSVFLRFTDSDYPCGIFTLLIDLENWRYCIKKHYITFSQSKLYSRSQNGSCRPFSI
jgi:hypothetical protein